MAYSQVKVPADGAKITIQGGKLQVPDHPILPSVKETEYLKGFIYELAR